MNALIIIDVQNDFLPDGALAVPQGDEVIPIINRLMPCFDIVVATQDWHPVDHGSFAANHESHEVGDVIELDGLSQVLWPVHCVQGSPGADFASSLHTAPIQEVFRKGVNPRIDSYSGFFDNGHRATTGLNDWLLSRGASQIYVAGLATDYCVKFTALDAAELGHETFLIADGCRGVNLQAGDVDRAIEAMQAAGVRIVNSDAVVNE